MYLFCCDHFFFSFIAPKRVGLEPIAWLSNQEEIRICQREERGPEGWIELCFSTS